MADDLTVQLHQIGHDARAAARVLATVSSEKKNEALLAMAEELIAQREKIIEPTPLISQRATQMDSQGQCSTVFVSMRRDSLR